MTALGVFLTVLFCLSVFILPRSLAAVALVASALYITQGQAIQVGLNLTAVRLVEISVFARVIIRGELSAIKFNSLDRWILIFLGSGFVITSFREGAVDTYQLGDAADGWIVYFSFRSLINNPDTYISFLRSLAFALVPFAVVMTYESATGHDLFAAMGGVPESPILREGHYRCQGSFRVAITAGTVGATCFSLFIGSLADKSHRLWAIIGVGACIMIVYTSHSSGPLTALGVGAIGWLCWRIRNKMTWVRRGIVGSLVVLQLLMNNPIWYIFDRLSGILGGDGWHRSNLIDKFVHSYRNWIVDGMDFLQTADWAATQLPTGGVDVTDYYISIGISAGLIAFVMFITLLTVCFKMVGRAGFLIRTSPNASMNLQLLLWGIGCTICCHVVNLTAVEYWDQSYVIWYLHLALVGSLAGYIIANHDAVSSLSLPTSDEGYFQPNGDEGESTLGEIQNLKECPLGAD